METLRIVVSTEHGEPLLLGTFIPPRSGDEDIVRYFDSSPDEEERIVPEDCVRVVSVDVA